MSSGDGSKQLAYRAWLVSVARLRRGIHEGCRILCGQFFAGRRVEMTHEEA